MFSLEQNYIGVFYPPTLTKKTNNMNDKLIDFSFSAAHIAHCPFLTLADVPGGPPPPEPPDLE